MGKTVLEKKTPGFGYKYTELADINTYLESNNIYYYQKIEVIDGVDYIVTYPIINGEEQPGRRGCRVITGTFDRKSNPAQEQGSGLTYARRYSLLMAFGLATEDDDAACMTKEKKKDGFPSREEMLELANRRYPKGSDELNKLLSAKGFEAKSLEDLSDNQLKAIYSKYEGK